MDIPDIVTVIVSQLRPIDNLMLSRTCHNYRIYKPNYQFIVGSYLSKYFYIDGNKLNEMIIECDVCLMGPIIVDILKSIYNDYNNYGDKHSKFDQYLRHYNYANRHNSLINGETSYMFYYHPSGPRICLIRNPTHEVIDICPEHHQNLYNYHNLFCENIDKIN